MRHTIHLRFSSCVSLALTTLTALGLTTRPAAADVTFSAPTAITTADATLNLAGDVVYAVNFGGLSSTVTLSNGKQITFTGSSFGGGTTTAYVSNSNRTHTGAFSGNTGNTNFNALLDSYSDYDGVTNPYQLVLNGLTVGQQYTAQIFDLNDGSPQSTKRNSFTAGANTSSTFLEGGNYYILASFTATATTQTIVENPLDGYAGFNDVILRTPAAATSVPEPAFYAMSSLLALGGGGLLSRRRKSRAY